MGEGFYYTTLSFKVCFGLYMLTFLIYALSFIIKKEWIEKLGILSLITSAIATAYLILKKWMASDVGPFVNYFDTIVLLTLTISLVSITALLRTRLKSIGLVTSFLIVGLLLIAIIKKNTGYATLMPELGSWLFLPHVFSLFLAYAFLIVAGLFSARALFYISEAKSMTDNPLRAKQISLFPSSLIWYGFTFLLLGTFFGMLWSMQNYNHYWSWEPKQSWTLVTIMIFAIYAILSAQKQVNSKVLHWVAILGLLAIMMTYLGTGYLNSYDTHFGSFLNIK